MKRNIINGAAFVALSIASFAACGGAGESIVLDPATGNYLITHYVDSEQAFEKLVFVPATKIDPSLKSELKLLHGGTIDYKYSLKSGENSKQAITRILFHPVSSVTTSMPDIPTGAPPGQIAADMLQSANYFDTPALWRPTMGYTDDQKAFRIGWYYGVDTGGLSPGDKAAFGFNSRDLPGIIQAEVAGYAPDTEKIDGEELPDEPGDDPFWKQYFSLIWHNFLVRPVAVPTLSVTSPFDGVSVLRQLKDNVTAWPSMTLIDGATATTISASLQTAIDQLGSGNNEAAIRTLKSIRSHLNQLLSNGKRDSDSEMPRDKQSAKGQRDNNAEQADANRHLVEDVLQFDLKYICRALGSDEKMDEDEKR